MHEPVLPAAIAILSKQTTERDVAFLVPSFAQIGNVFMLRGQVHFSLEGGCNERLEKNEN